MTEDREGHGLQPIGSQISAIASSLTESDSTPPRSPQASATTGLPVPVSGRSSSIGLQRGAIGAVAKLREGTDPAATDRAVRASWPRAVAQWHDSPSLMPATASLQAKGYRWMTTPLPPQADREAALAILEESIRPSERAPVAKALTATATLTVTRGEDGDDTEAWVALMADWLHREYPLDAIRHVLRACPSRSRWRPTPADLKPHLDDACRWRRRQLSDLSGHSAPP